MNKISIKNFLILFLTATTPAIGIDSLSTVKILYFNDLISRGILRNPITNAITHCRAKNDSEIMMILEITYHSKPNIYKVSLTECADYTNEIFGAVPISVINSDFETYYFDSDSQLQNEYKLQKEHPTKLLQNRKLNINKYSQGLAYYKMPLDSFKVISHIKFEEELDCPSECSNIYQTYSRFGNLVYIFKMNGYHSWELIDICSDCLPKCFKIDNYIFNKPLKDEEKNNDCQNSSQ